MASGYWRIGEDNTEKIVDSENDIIYYKTKAPHILTEDDKVVTKKAILLDFPMANYWDSDIDAEITIFDVNLFIKGFNPYMNAKYQVGETQTRIYDVEFEPIYNDDDGKFSYIKVTFSAETK